MKLLLAWSSLPLLFLSLPADEISLEGKFSEVEKFVREHSALPAPLTITGEGRSVRAQADLAEVTVEIRAEASRLSVALANAEKVEKRIAELVLEELKLPANALHRQAFIHQASDKGGKSGGDAVAVKRVRLQLQRADQLVKLATELEKSAEAKIVLIETKLADEFSLRGEAIEAAFADLQKNLDLYEQKLGLQLHLQEIRPYQVQAATDRRGEEQPAVGLRKTLSSLAEYSKQAFGSGQGLEFGFGEIEFVCTVEAVYTFRTPQ